MDQADMQFIENLFRSLEGEMRRGFAEIKHDVNRRFDEVDSRLKQMNDRLDRVGGLVNGGARAMATVIEWSERSASE